MSFNDSAPETEPAVVLVWFASRRARAGSITAAAWSILCDRTVRSGRSDGRTDGLSNHYVTGDRREAKPASQRACLAAIYYLSVDHLERPAAAPLISVADDRHDRPLWHRLTGHSAVSGQWSGHTQF